MNEELRTKPTAQQAGGNSPHTDQVDSQSESPDATKNQSSSASDILKTPKRRVTFFSCLITLLVVGGVTIGAGVIIQPYLKPKADPNLTAPVAVKAKEDTSEAEALAGLPEHSITRGITQRRIESAKHPLIPLLRVAQTGLDWVNENVQDYSATIVSQVRLNGELGEERYMFCKILHEQELEEGKKIPLSMYTRFLKPQSLAGQEAIWIKGYNKGKIIAHGAGLLNVKKLYLNPDGPIAMKGSRYPIRKLGMKNLIKQLIVKGKRDMKHDECIASVKRGVMVDGCTCTMLEIKHPKQREHFEFHIARIYLDDERNIPLAYEGYLWPEKEGDDPPLLEKYFYTDVKLNIGLRGKDFSTKNPEYDYPRW